MKMRCVGKGVYHRGPGGIEQPGDFGWRIYAAGVDERGAPNGVPASIEIVMYCTRFGTCAQHVRQGPHGDADGRRYWGWDGNWESPTIAPSIGCEDTRYRCGQHVNIVAGVMLGPVIAPPWTHPPKPDPA